VTPRRTVACRARLTRLSQFGLDAAVPADGGAADAGADDPCLLGGWQAALFKIAVSPGPLMPAFRNRRLGIPYA
jgi:hypothetical protein